jgi:threonine/homoserine/homoserine lactone efflux protein
MLALFIKGFLLGFPNAALPGPFQAYLLSQTIKNGWKSSLILALAPFISDGPIIIITLFILSQMPVQILLMIQTAGGIFLLFLAFKAFQNYRRTAWREKIRPFDEAYPKYTALLKGALVNFLNPNAYIFWSTIGGPIILRSWRVSPSNTLAFLIGFYGTLIIGLGLFIILSGTIGQIKPQVNKILSLFSATALMAFGLWQLTQAIPGIV